MLQAADLFNAGTGAPRQAETSLHVAYKSLGAPDYTIVCGLKPARSTEVAAALDDPRFCPKCLAGRPHATGSSVRVVVLLVAS